MTATAPPTSEYLAAPNSVLSAPNGIDYAYRQVGVERHAEFGRDIDPFLRE